MIKNAQSIKVKLLAAGTTTDACVLIYDMDLSIV
jgi:hypothetical protein